VGRAFCQCAGAARLDPQAVFDPIRGAWLTASRIYARMYGSHTKILRFAYYPNFRKGHGLTQRFKGFHRLVPGY
jgi:hypothetical protein